MASYFSSLVIRASATAQLDGSPAPYGYTPTRWICFLFVSLFGFSTILHVILAFKARMKWLFLTLVVCSFGETIGWGGRLWSSYDIYAIGGFQMQICCTIFSPTFTLAGIFVILGKLIVHLGPEYSRMTPKVYSWIFISADMVALSVQAVGGGIASAVDPFKGGNIMLGGIAFQLVVLTFATIFAGEYFIRYILDKPLRGYIDAKTRTMMLTMCFVTLLLMIRAVYRTIELADGWTGKIIGTELYFNVFDGAMIALAQYTLVVFHPMWLLPKIETNDGSKVELTSLV
ncbi:RTA1-domain-containing protein [Flagelloscypha sp. PMI_526]|nr:RTA1-domain-containing protein [Flagelloscypha sp. PMI_526]